METLKPGVILFKLGDLFIFWKILGPSVAWATGGSPAGMIAGPSLNINA
jgi:hypothetical protein